jgi:hypothetical protein
MAPKRELPALHIKIVADPSSALKSIGRIVAAAVKGSKRISKAVKEQVDNAEKEFLREFHNYRLLQKSKEIQHKKTQRRMKAIDDAARKEREAADKASAERRKQIEKDTVDFFKKQSKRQAGFDNADGNKNYGRLTGFGRSVRSAAGRDKPVKNPAFDNLVKNAEENAKQTVKAAAVQKAAMASANTKLAQQVRTGARIQRERSDEAHKEQRQASRRMWSAKRAVIIQRRKDIADEAAIMAKAAAERTKQVAQSRKAVQQQNDQFAKEDRRATSRMWARKRDYIIQSRKDAAKRTKDLAGANARLAAMVKSGAKAQRIEANAAHRQSRRESRRMWSAKRAVIIQNRKDAAERASNMASANAKLAQQVKSGARIQRQQAAEAHKAARHASHLRWSAKKAVIIQNRKDAAERAKEAAEQAKEDARQLRRHRQRLVRRLKAQRAMGSFGSRMGKAVGGMAAGNMMGARADVYMHKQSLDTIGRGIVSFMQPYTEVENATVAMEVFTGSIETAKATVAELNQYAIESPYALSGVLEASTVMMKYGTSAKDAVKYTKMLGDVAGGNSHKMELLGLALGQMKGIGTVQGQEVRQMVNAGFNPLAVAAKEMAGGDGASEEAIEAQMQILMDAMRKRKLDWKIVVKALEVATSEGGDFAGMADKLSKTLTGMASQIMETFNLVKKELAEHFTDDLKAAMKEILRYATALVAFVKDGKNKELIKSYVETGLAILKFIVVLHAVGFAFAWLKWMIGTLGMFLGGLMALFRGLVVVLTGVRSALLFLFPVLNSLRLSFIGTWIAALGPIAWVIAAVLFLYVILAGLTHEGGFAGLVGDWIKALYGFIGFFYNFSHNINNMWSFVMKNMVLLLIDGVLLIMSQFIMLGKLAAQVIDSITGTKLRASIDSTIEGIRGMAGTNGKYDTSMLEFGMPTMDDMMQTTGIKDALKPYLPEDKPYVIPDKPDVDFKSFIKGGVGEAGTGAPAPDHAVRGSSDHAVRMYKYGEAARAEAEGGGKDTHEDRTEDLLGRIERNTRSSTNPNAMIEEAALV